MAARQIALDFGQRPALGADDFLVADSNREVVAWLDRWPDWPAPALTIHGPAGSGKTHLAQVWRAQVAAGRAGGGAAGPAPMIAGAALAQALPEDLLAGACCCVVEDAHAAVAGDAAREQGLFHLYNRLAEAGGHMLLTGRTAPAGWPIGLPDLRSRLLAAPTAALSAPDDALISAVLVKLFADRQLRVGPGVVDFLLRRMERSFAGAGEIVAAIDAAALDRRRNITVPLVREVLAGGALDRDEDHDHGH